MSARVGDTQIPVTISLRDAVSGAIVDLSGYDTAQLVLRRPDKTETAVAATLGVSAVSATVAVFDQKGTWRLSVRLSHSGTGVQRTSRAVSIGVEPVP